ncbi:unnamed protein product [Macrosiphum euphorbiae]|uniref:Reverse transcriptase domain-containing protein n=1 Tax=Macrosiphum euphorbiae TaxID=13131 RepID=A0AAV0XVK8_9HEMI|nr:unnamed protein product [Macrosiphum euphorbiae]
MDDGGSSLGISDGPLLWNVFYDSLMSLDLLQGVHIVCFANDVAIVATGHTTRLLEIAMNDYLAMVAGWMDSHGLTISSSKSTAVMLTTKLGYVKPTFLYRDVQIELCEHRTCPGESPGSRKARLVVATPPDRT